MADLELLKGLLQRYSPTRQEEQAVTFLVGWMNNQGYRAFVDGAGNAVGVLGDGPREVMLLGHIDTVPGFIEVRQEGDLLFGRGAVDAKGPLACFAAAGAKVVPPPGWRITVVGAVGEEDDSRGALYLREWYKPEYLIIGEPSKWDRITLGFKGSMGVEYSVCKETAHTASGRQSAPEAAVEFWNGLKAWCDSLNPPEGGAFAQLTPTLKSMSSTTDGFSEMAGLKIGLRLPPGIQPGTVIAKLAELKGEGEVCTEDPVPPFRSDKNNALVRAFLNAIRSQGGTPVFSLKTGTSDMNLVAPAWGCPAVAYGPGDSTLDHTPGEHVSLSEYYLSIEVLKNVLDLLVK